jgi:hypothetical protein
MSRKPAKKADRKADRALVVPEHGRGAIYQGAPANPVAGPGRPPDEFRRAMRELASSDAALRYLRECLEGEHGPAAALKAQEYAAERGYGKAPATVVLEGGQPIQVQVTHVVVDAAGADQD